MIYPAPPLAFFMGGETYNDPISMATAVFGAGAIDDGNWPGNTGDSDGDDDSAETVPNTHRFVADPDKPAAHGDYPLRQCAATGYWGAPHAMVMVDGRWYLRAHAPDPRSAKRYPPTNQP